MPDETEAGLLLERLRAAAAAIAGAGDVDPRRESVAPTVARFYATTCADVPGTGGAYEIVSIPIPPRLSAAEPAGLKHAFLDPASVLYDLGMSSAPDKGTWANNIRTLEPDQLLDAMLYARPDRGLAYRGELGQIGAHESQDYAMDDMAAFGSHVKNTDPGLALFTGRVLHESLVPVEHSPAKATSVAKLAASSGADIALVLSGTHDPIVLIVAPAVVVIMGAATGVASGFRKGLEQKIFRWLTGVEVEGEDPSGNRDKSDGD